MGVTGNVSSAQKTFGALAGLALTGLILLIIFGNLSGNLGFANVVSTVTNESNGYAINGTTYTLASASASTFLSSSVTTVYNATDGTVIGSGNFTTTTTGTIVGATGRTSNWTDVNITYEVTSQSTDTVNSNSVIGNITGGVTTFFGFAGVWFTLLAVVLLITIVVGIMGAIKSKTGSRFSS